MLGNCSIKFLKLATKKNPYNVLYKFRIMCWAAFTSFLSLWASGWTDPPAGDDRHSVAVFVWKTTLAMILGILTPFFFLSKTLFVLPRPTRASLPTLPSQVYDVPVRSRVSSTLKVSFPLQPCSTGGLVPSLSSPCHLPLWLPSLGRLTPLR